MTNFSKINTIIIEDEIEIQNLLISILKENFPQVTIKGKARTIKNAIELIKDEDPELVLMDIELLDGLSFKIFDSISTPSFEVIFITAFENHIKQALNHFAMNYIMKPIDKESLIAAVNHYIQLRSRLFNKEKLNLVRSFNNDKDGRLFIQTTNEHILMFFKDILKIESYGNYSYIYDKGGDKFLASKNLKYYETLLPSNIFFKANRTALVNINHIKSVYKKETITLLDNSKTRVSVRNKSNLTQLMETFNS